MQFNVNRRGYAFRFFENLIESSFGIKAALQRNTQNGQVIVGRIDSLFFELARPVLVDQFIKNDCLILH